MSFAEVIMKPSDVLRDIGRPMAYYPALAKITGGVKPAILLCQLMYWTGKQHDPDGWIYKVSSEIEAETGMTWREQQQARKKLVQRKLISEQRDYLNHRILFKVECDQLDASWARLSTNPQPPNQQKRNLEINEPSIRKSTKRQSVNKEQRIPSETTRENETETQLGKLPARKNGSREAINQEGISLLKEALKKAG